MRPIHHVRRHRLWLCLACAFAWCWGAAFAGAQRCLPARTSALGAVSTAEAARAELRDETRLLRETVTDLVSEVRQLRQRLTDTEEPQVMPSPVAEVQVQTPLPTPPAPPVQAAPVQSPVAQAPPTPRSKGPAKGTTAIKVVSAGGDAGNIADFFLEDQQVPIGGMSNRRGLNVVVIDSSAGHLLSAKTYDIWGNPVEENRRLAKDMRAVEEDNIVLVALKDSGMENLDAEGLHALQSVGSTLEGRLAFRQGYALIGVKDGEALAERKGPMVMAEAKLHFAVRPPQAPVRAR
ncbi:Cemip2 [Symbiodinium pilosum]|uniref:Cemip2 protein n=1 Tax=Symbiodinium pilosum TaxID=2952 RepID=A0A812YLA7_SYMPI|nr:Cemip2 [Symbiodinium pilosum]